MGSAIMSAARVALLALATAAVLGCSPGGAAPIRGEKRNELCRDMGRAPAFHCPGGTNRSGKPPPEGSEMWCQRWDGTRHGSYRRFPPGSAEVEERTFAGDGTVIGEYREGVQHGAWWTWRPGATYVNVAYYDGGKLVQRVHCRP
jgi:hypothetical protein